MSNAIIRRIYETRLKTWADAQTPVLKIAFENVGFMPASMAFLRGFLLPANTDSQDLQGLHREYLGLYQIDVVRPAGEGAGAAEAIVAQLEALFPLNLRLSLSGLTVQITRPLAVSAAVVDPDRYAIPCRVTYRADLIP